MSILTSEIKGNSVPVSAIWHSSERDLCHYLDTGTVWLKSFVVDIKYNYSWHSVNVIKTFATTKPYKDQL